ncbi:MAG: SGNH/GDSL hydrolase family protein [Saccharofermentans sp.]|nr:SGNH/GDSL hydrolase family protein [Saccharofermentans sp.]
MIKAYALCNVEEVEVLDIYDQSGLVRSEYDNEFYQVLSQSDVVYFIGDSITCGSANGGHPWYEPITKAMDIEYDELAFSGCTTFDMIYVLNNTEAVSNGKYSNKEIVFVITLGTNDVLSGNPQISAKDDCEYIEYMETIVTIISDTYPDAHFVLIAPWRAYGEIDIVHVPLDEQRDKFDKFDAVLATYCEDNGYLYVEPNSYIEDHLVKGFHWYYLCDELHPNSRFGCTLYSEAVLKYE